MNKERFEFNNLILSEFSDSEVRDMCISIENTIDILYTLSDMAREAGDISTSKEYENLAFHLHYIVPNF